MKKRIVQITKRRIALAHPLVLALLLVTVIFGAPRPASATFLGWAVGDFGTIRHTSNGGATWAGQTSGTDVVLRGVAFVSTAPVPEPATLLLLGSGLAGFGAGGWWKRRRTDRALSAMPALPSVAHHLENAGGEDQRTRSSIRPRISVIPRRIWWVAS